MSGVQTLENVDRTRNAGSAKIVRHADPRVPDLVRVQTPELKDTLVDLPDAGGADRVPLRQQSAAGIDGTVAADPRSSFSGITSALPARYDAEVFGIDDLGDRETIVKFDEIDVRRLDSGLLIGHPRGANGCIKAAEIRMAGDPGAPARLDRGRMAPPATSCRRSSAIKSTAAAPSLVGQQSNGRSGSQISGD
jgi:hypothetical protein